MFQLLPSVNFYSVWFKKYWGHHLYLLYWLYSLYYQLQACFHDGNSCGVGYPTGKNNIQLTLTCNVYLNAYSPIIVSQDLTSHLILGRAHTVERCLCQAASRKANGDECFFLRQAQFLKSPAVTELDTTMYVFIMLLKIQIGIPAVGLKSLYSMKPY